MKKRKFGDDKIQRKTKPIKKVKFDLKSNNIIDIPKDQGDGDDGYDESDSDDDDDDPDDLGSGDSEEEDEPESGLPISSRPVKGLNGRGPSDEPPAGGKGAAGRRDIFNLLVVAPMLTLLFPAASPLKTGFPEEYNKSIRVYEKLKTKKLPREERVKLVSEFISLMKGKFKDFLLKRTFCRAFECALKYGSKEQKSELACEVGNLFTELPKNVYGKHIMIRMIHNCGLGVRTKICKSFNGHVSKFARHSSASLVLGELYNYSNSSQRKKLFMEFYGPEYVLLSNEAAYTLNDILKDSEIKKKSVLKHMRENIDSIISRSNLQLEKLSIIHDLLYEYSEHIDTEAMAGLIDITKDRLVSIIHTDNGMRFACKCLSFANIRAKKEILSTFKSHIRRIACDSNAYTVLIAFLCRVNDVKFLKNHILDEFFDSTKDESVSNAEMFRNKYAAGVASFMLAGGHPPFPSYMANQIKNKIKESYMNIASDYPFKKRCQVIEAISENLTKVICESVEVFVRDPNASNLVLSAIYNLNDPTPIIDKISQLLTDDLGRGEDGGESFHAVKKLSKQIESSTYLKEGIDLSQNIALNYFSSRIAKSIICAEKLLKLLHYPQEFIDRAKDYSARFISSINDKMTDLVPATLQKCIETPSEMRHVSILIISFLEHCDQPTLKKIRASIPPSLIPHDTPLKGYISKNLLSTSEKKTRPHVQKVSR